MKKISVLLLCVVLGFSSCTDVAVPADNVTVDSKTPSVNQLGNAAGRQLPHTKVEIIQTAGGEYVSSYGASGVSFGTSFIHPTTVDASGITDGQPIPEYEFVTLQAPTTTLQSSKDGARFVLVQPTFGEPPTATEIHNYMQGLSLYWAWVDHPLAEEVERPEPLGNSSGGGGTIEIRGQVVRDHNSPTNASIVPDDYVYQSPGVGLGGLYKFNRIFVFYGPSLYTGGTVTQVTVRDASSNFLTVTSFSCAYTSANGGVTIHVTGTVNVGSNHYSINDDISTP